MKTDFKIKVYQVVKKIPRGKVMSYVRVARLAGNPRAARAAGRALSRNPFWPKVPCHRVIYSNGQVGSWSGKGGMREKIELLKKEGVKIKNNKVTSFWT
jgi:methylated-DNA-[protein]-cysteine S-methyltransferase